MKRLIIFLLLFAAIKVAGQTTGYLRFDTVRIMKQNGTCELYIINKTKDSLGLLTNVGGGLTQFRKSRVLNDSTIIIGLDTLVIKGGAGGGGGSGSVTSITQGYGIIATPNPITSTGIIKADTTGSNGLVTRHELIDSTDLTTQLESPLYVKLRSSWPVPDTLALDSTIMATRARSIKIADSVVANRVKYSDTTSMLANYIRDANDGLTKTGQVASITNNGVTDAKIRQSAGNSVIGRSTNSTGNVADITASSDNQVLRRSGTTLGFGAVNLASTNAVTGQLPEDNLAAFKIYPAERPLGVIYEANSFSDISADLQPNPAGTNTLAISSGKLQSSAASFSYNNYVRILPHRPTLMSNWKVTMRFRNTAWSANSFEIGLGIYSAITHSGAQFGYIGFVQTTSSGSGNLFIYDQQGSSQKATGSGAVTSSLNDLIEVTYSLIKDTVLVFTAQNLTTSGTLRTSTYTFPSNQSVILANMGNWGIFEGNGGTGTHQIEYLKIESDEVQAANLMVIGNSKTKIGFANNWEGRFADSLAELYPTTIWSAGSAERLTDMLQRARELATLNPAQVLLADVVSNELRAGTSFTEVVRLYRQLTKTFTDGGTPVYHCVFPEDSTGGGLGMTAWNAWLNAEYGANVINTYGAMSTGNIGNATYLNADKVHLTQAGNNIIVSTIVSSGLIQQIDPNRRTPYQANDANSYATGYKSNFAYPIQAALNRVLRFSSDGKTITTGPVYLDSVKMIISDETRPTAPLSNGVFHARGPITTYGVLGSIFLYGRTSGSQFYSLYHDNSTLFVNANGTDIAYWKTNGGLRLGNSPGTTAATMPSMFQIRVNQTLANAPGVLGAHVNIDTMTTTMPNTGGVTYTSNSFGRNTLTSTVAGNANSAYNVYIDDSVVAGTNYAILKSYALYINRGRTRLGTVDSTTSATGGFLYKDFATGDVKMTASPGGSDGNGIYSGSGALQSGTTNVTGGGVSTLVLGTSGSKLAAFSINASGAGTVSADARLNLFGGISYKGVAYSTDANLTMDISTGILELATGSLTTNRTITLPTAQVNGQVVTIVVRFASSGSHYVLNSAVEDIKTGTTFTQLEWGTTYDFMVNASIGWMLIRKY